MAKILVYSRVFSRFPHYRVYGKRSPPIDKKKKGIPSRGGTPGGVGRTLGLLQFTHYGYPGHTDFL